MRNGNPCYWKTRLFCSRVSSLFCSKGLFADGEPVYVGVSLNKPFFFLAFAFGILAIILVAEPFAIVYNKILSFQHIKKLKKLIYIRFLAFSLFSNKLAFQLFKSQPNIIFCFPEVETKQHYPPISLFFLVSSFLRSFSSVVRKAVLR
jgi:hypothetical protein